MNHQTQASTVFDFLMNFSTQTLLGWWSATGGSLALDSLSVADAVRDLHSPLLIVNTSQGPALARGGIASLGSTSHDPESFPIMGVVPPARLEQLGDQSFRQDFQLRYNYVSGSMAAGSGSERSGVEASAYLDLTPHVVRYRLHGIHRGPDGGIRTPNRIIAKVSRIEVGSKFFAPASARILAQLVEQGHLSAEQAQLAEHVPVAQDITAEADSGGHTDNRPALTLLPTILALRDRAAAQYQFAQPLRVGAAGGIATPASAAAAFAMGAAYILVGSVQQACVESGTCDAVRQMLAEAEQADVTMCPCADMFEMGVKVQVLKRGTMFPMRAAKLYETYRNFSGIDQIPAAEREWLEKNLFRTSLQDPAQIEKGEKDPKHQMALVFRWYLGQSSRWANSGEASRRLDYQIWCGPAMGAFNEWTRGTFLSQPSNRTVATVAGNLLYGTAVMQRLNALRNQGFEVPVDAARITPLEPAALGSLFQP